MHDFKSCKFIDVGEKAFVNFNQPSSKWAVIDDCGEWPCTAPENIVLRFEDSDFSGTTPVNTDSDGTITYALGEDPYYNCDYKEDWNAW